MHHRLLIERLGFEKTFLVTATIKSLSYFALVPLLPLVSALILVPTWLPMFSAR